MLLEASGIHFKLTLMVFNQKWLPWGTNCVSRGGHPGIIFHGIHAPGPRIHAPEYIIHATGYGIPLLEDSRANFMLIHMVSTKKACPSEQTVQHFP